MTGELVIGVLPQEQSTRFLVYIPTCQSERYFPEGGISVPVRRGKAWQGGFLQHGGSHGMTCVQSSSHVQVPEPKLSYEVFFLSQKHHNNLSL